MEANNNSISLNEDSVTTTIGNTQIVHTKDGMTFTKLETGEYFVVPSSSVPTINSINNCDPHFGIDQSLINCEPHFGIDQSVINCDPRFGIQIGIDQSNTTIDTTISVGDFSDGYHTFNELYEHRTALFATICRLLPERAWKSRLHCDETMYDGMFIAGIETPEGSYSYHCEEKYWEMFVGVPELTHAPQWDGHKPEDYGRLFSLKRHELPDLGKLAWNEGEEA